MKEKERIAQLEKELQTVTEQRDGLLKKLKEAETFGLGKGKSKSRLMAEEGLKMLEAGPVTAAQLKTLNDKYPSDVVYYIRTMLKVDVKTVRSAAGTVYMTPEQHATHSERLQKDKAAKEASEKEAKEAIPPAAPLEAAVEVTA
jgi:hypothetical protein